MKLKHITFTGLDSKTSVYAIQNIQKEWPIAEFGILLSKNWSENGPRYPDIRTIERFLGLGLNLSTHLCGSIAREAYSGKWDTAYKTYPHLFDDGSISRAQLNVSTYVGTQDPEKVLVPGKLSNPIGIGEIIVQQSSPSPVHSEAYRDLVEANGGTTAITMLVDPSGGEGKDYAFDILPTNRKIGYAGGINAMNVERKLRYLLECDEVGDFWIDMESGVRDKDWIGDRLNIDKVVEVLRICDDVIKDYR